jgi:acyl carrier protein
MSIENVNIVLEEEIRDLIIDKLNIDYISKEEVDFDAPIFSSFDGDKSGLGLDSVDVLEILAALRGKYGIEIKNNAFDIFKNIRSIADFVRIKQV